MKDCILKEVTTPGGRCCKNRISYTASIYSQLMLSSKPMDFKWRHFHVEVILQCVRWYCKYGISYRDLEEMMAERGVVIDHTTLYRWVQYYAPKLKNRLDGIRNFTPKAGLLMRLTSN